MVLRHSKSRYYGVRCDGALDAATRALCEHTVLIDWWWAGDRSLADGFGETFDAFERYSRWVQEDMRVNISAPHTHWGLYFFRVLRLRSLCQLGFVMLHGLDFTLGRFLPAGINARSTCRFADRESWRPLWQPPSRRTGSCDAIPGYMTMCPGTPARPVEYPCSR